MCFPQRLAIAFLLLACTVFGNAATNSVSAVNTFSLPFAPTDVQFDPARPFLYATDRAGKAVYRVSITTGVVAKKYQFAYEPERMAITPNGTHLYVALLTRPHDRLWMDAEGHVGYIAEIELATGNLLRQFEINEDPFDLVATDGGILVVTSGSGQVTSIRSYRISTGENLSSAEIYQRSRLTLHPSQAAVYTADTEISPSDIARYNLDPVTGTLTAAGDSPYHGDYPMYGNVFAHPNGALLISRGGAVFTSSTNQVSDMTYVRTLERGFCDDVAFDAMRPAMITIARKDPTSGRSPSLLDVYNRKTLELATTYLLPDTAHFVGVKPKFVYVVSSYSQTAVLRQYPNPAIGLENNKAPVARFAWSPTNTTTLKKIVFDASTSSDENSAQLQYRWDWDNDGIFDTSFTTRRVATNHFNTAGAKTVTLQVKDSFGAIGQTKRVISVALQADPGKPGYQNVPYDFGFPAAHVVFDSNRPYVYGTDPVGNRLVKMNLTNGLVERVFRFTSRPGRMVITPNGQRLYVTLSPTTTLSAQISGGYIAEFDLRQNVKTREIAISRAAFDLLATDAGTLVTTTEGWTAVRSYDLSTGAELSSFNSFGYSTRIALHPSQQAIYFSDFSSDFEKLEIGPGGILTNHHLFYRPDYNGEYGKLVFFNETNVVSNGGKVYSISNPERTNFQFVANLDSGVCADAYIDSTRGAMFRLKPSDWRSPALLTAINLSNLRAFFTNQLPDNAMFAGGHGNKIYVADMAWERTRISKFANPALGLEANIAPVASFTWDATNISTLTQVTFDASLSSDESGSLSYRWDWNSDGHFDTPFTNTAFITKRFNTAGTKTVTLEVRDRYGAFHQNAQSFDVTLEADSGVPGTTNEPFNLPFAPAHVVFDSSNRFLYATDSARQRLVKLNLANGLIEREFQFDYIPERMVMTPNGSRLYLALLSRPHTNGTPVVEDRYIAEFDLQAGVKTKEFAIPQDPFDLAATDDGILIVGGGSSYETDIASYDIATGTKLGTNQMILAKTELTLHPSQKAVYLTTWNSRVHKFEIQPNGTLARTIHLQGTNTLAVGKIHFASETNSIITSGTVYSHTTERTNFQVIKRLEHGAAHDMAVDTASAALFAVKGRDVYYDVTPGKCAVYDLGSYAPIYSLPVANSIRYVGSTGDSMWLVYVGDESGRIERVPNPAIGAATNTAPVANFTWSPETPTTFSETVFDGSLSSDNLDRPEDLLYRWDWENDGVFDTEFARQTNAAVTLKTFGPRYVTLEVKDRHGLTNRITKPVTIASVPDPGEAYEGTNAAFTLPFIPNDTVFDAHGPYLYASDADERRVVKFNLTNGLIERVYRFEQRPQPLALTPDGRRMYVGAMDDSTGNWNMHPGLCTIAEFDLLNGTRTQEFIVNQKPTSLAASDDGVIGAVGASGGSYRFRTYSRTNGVLLDDMFTTTQTRVAFDPFENAFYAVAKKFLINPVTGRLTSSANSSVYPNPFVHPDGIHIIANGGEVYRKVNGGGEELALHLKGSSFAGLLFHTNYSAMLAFYYDRIQVYNSASLEWVSTIDPRDEILSLGRWNDSLYIVTRTNNHALVRPFRHPMASGHMNQPPVPDFTWTPKPATTFSALQFDPAATVDDLDSHSTLQFRWDLDGNGTFESLIYNQMTAQRRFLLGGNYRVGLQVRDRFGAVASIYKDIIVKTANINDGSLIWRHKDGRSAVWTMSGGVRVRSSLLASGQTLAAGWKVGGVADFNGDGYRDILWANGGRSLKVWCLNGPELLESVTLKPALPSGWYLKGVSDFNADSHADLLLQNTAGSVSVRFMNRTNFVSSVLLNDGLPVNSNWKFVGTGDLNGDSHPEIVWRGLNNSLAASFMSGTNIVSNRAFKGPVMSSDWSVIAVADYNGDKRADILWSNKRTGEVGAWIMIGAQYQSYLRMIAPGAAPTDWRLLNSP